LATKRKTIIGTMLTQDCVKELFTYDPDTGCFSRNKPLRNGYTGPVGNRRPDGYLMISIQNKKFLAHRLAVLYMTGYFPEGVVDHIDGDPSNNKWSNLRECSQGQNNTNKKWMSNNASGYKGVYFHKGAQKWLAQLVVNKQYVYLGLFNNIEEAAQVAKEAREKHHGAFARHV